MSSSESKDDRADEVEAAESAPSLDPRHCKDLVGNNAIETLSGEQVLAMMRAAAPDQKLKYPLHVALSHARFALRDVAALAAVPDVVKSLSLAHNRLTTLAPPADAWKLAKRCKRLNVSHCKLADAALRHWSALRTLVLRHNRLRSVPLLERCKHLAHVDLAHNAIAGGVERLAACGALEHVDLAHNLLHGDAARLRLLALVPLRTHCAALRSLNVAHNPALRVAELDFFVLAELPQLDYVNARAVAKAERKRADELAASGKWADSARRTFALGTRFAPPCSLRPPRSLATQRHSQAEQLPVFLAHAAAAADARGLASSSGGAGDSRSRAATTRGAALSVSEKRVRSATKMATAAAAPAVLTARLLASFFLEPLEQLEYPVVLDLSSDALRLESAELGKLLGDVLDELDLSNNRLTSISSLSRFARLRVLRIANNRLRSFSTGGLAALRVLDLSKNELRHIPPCADAQNLRELRLAHNRIVHGFEELRELQALRVLDLSHNQLEFNMSQAYHHILQHLQPCALLEAVSFVGNAMTETLPKFRLWCVHELPALCWVDGTFVFESERTSASEHERVGLWKQKLVKPTALTASARDESELTTTPLSPRSRNAKSDERTLDVPAALNLLAQVEADDMTLRPLESLSDVIEQFVSASDDDRKFVFEKGSDADESLGSLLHTLQTTFEKSTGHRRELMQLLVTLSGVQNESLHVMAVQIINVVLLSVDEKTSKDERAALVSVLKSTFDRLMAPQYSTSVHAAVTHNLGQLVPFHNDLALDVCDEPLLVAALARTLSERNGRAAVDALTLLVDLARLALRSELVDDAERGELLGLYALPSVLGDVLQRRATVYTDIEVVRRLGELFSDVVKRYPALVDDAAAHCNALASAVRLAVEAASFDSAAEQPEAETPVEVARVTASIASADEQKAVRYWVTLGDALLQHGATAVALNKAHFGDELAHIVSATLSVNPPDLPLFKLASGALARLLYETPGAAHNVSVHHPHLPVRLMRLLTDKSSVRERLALRWRRMGAVDSAPLEQLSSGLYDAVCESLVWLTQHTPKEDEGPSTQKRNAVLEHIVTERPESDIGKLIRDTFGIQPRPSLLGRIFGRSKS